MRGYMVMQWYMVRIFGKMRGGIVEREFSKKGGEISAGIEILDTNC